MLDDKKITEVVEFLVDSTNSVDTAMALCEIPDGMREALEAALAEYIFLCECCGWWASIDDLNNDSGEEFWQECAEDQ